MADQIPILKVLRILDRTTLVLMGTGLEEIDVGNKLLVLGTGPEMPEFGGTLYVPKVEVEVTANAGDYVLARSPIVEREEQSHYALFSAAPRVVRRRDHLLVADEELSGNPASRPIQLGDYVIRKSDLAAFVQYQKATSVAAREHGEARLQELAMNLLKPKKP